MAKDRKQQTAKRVKGFGYLYVCKLAAELRAETATLHGTVRYAKNKSEQPGCEKRVTKMVKHMHDVLSELERFEA